MYKSSMPFLSGNWV